MVIMINSTSDLYVKRDRIIFAQIVSLILLFIITIITILGNILVITAILKTPKLRNLSNYLILSLSVTDLMVGLLVMPNSAIIDIIYLSEWTFGAVFCDIHFSVLSICTSASSLHLVFIAIDRYLSVTKFQYSMKKKKWHILSMIIVSWTLPTLFSLITIIWWRDDSKFLERIKNGVCWVSADTTRLIASISMKFYIPLVIIITLYALIYKKSVYFIRKYNKRSNVSIKTVSGSSKGLKNSKVSHGSDSNDNRIEAANNGCDQQIKSVKQMRREVKVAKTLAVITIAYILCLLPFNAYVLVNIWSKGYTKLGLDICLWLLFINSSVNPILYAYFNKNFRKAFKDILISWRIINKSI